MDFHGASPVIGDDDEGGIVPSALVPVVARVEGGGRDAHAGIQLSPEEQEALADGIVTLEEILQGRASGGEAASSQEGGEEEVPPWLLEGSTQGDFEGSAPGPSLVTPPRAEPVNLDSLGASLLESGGEDRSLRFASFGVGGLRVGDDAGERDDLVRQARDRGLRGVCGLIGHHMPVNKALRDQARSAALPKSIRLPQPTNPGRPRKEAPHAAQDKLDAVSPEKPTTTVRHAVFGSFEDMIPNGGTPASGTPRRRGLSATPSAAGAAVPLKGSRSKEEGPGGGPSLDLVVPAVVVPEAINPAPETVPRLPLPAATGAEHRAVEEVGLPRPNPELVAAIDLHEGEVRPAPEVESPTRHPNRPERGSGARPSPAARPTPSSTAIPKRGTSWGLVAAAGVVGGALAGGLLLAWRGQGVVADGSVQAMTERRLAARGYLQGEIEAMEFRLGSLDLEIDGLVAEMGRQDAQGKGELVPRLEVKARERARILVVLEALKARRRAIDAGKGM